MNAINSKRNVQFEHLECESVDFPDLANYLSVAGNYYPNFKSWLYFTFRKEMIEGQRSIIMARDGNNVAGLSLLKHTLDENKICTFFVSPSYRGNGVGHQLMNASTSYLEGKDIKITVAEERNRELYPLLLKNGFSVENKVMGYYRKNADEYFYSLKA